MILAEIKREEVFSLKSLNLLNNEKFLAKASQEKIDYERQKYEDSLARIAIYKKELDKYSINNESFFCSYPIDFSNTFTAIAYEFKLKNYCATMYICYLLYSFKKLQPIDSFKEVYAYFCKHGKFKENIFRLLNMYNFSYSPVQGIEEDYALLENKTLMYLYKNHIDRIELNQLEIGPIENIYLIQEK